jgi:hypothetical protein
MHGTIFYMSEGCKVFCATCKMKLADLLGIFDSVIGPK